jgi:hypothetical protein
VDILDFFATCFLPGLAPTYLGPSPEGSARLNGISIDFSYKTCLKPRTHQQRVEAAMRTEAQLQVNAYYESRKSVGTLVWDQPGIPLEADGIHAAYFRS